jgi:ubiquitin-conjugating enzyme E2 J2
MASKACLMRLQKEYQRLNKEPLPDIVAEPRWASAHCSTCRGRGEYPRGLSAGIACVRRPNNILEWHFVIKGPKDTPYVGGSYHGKLVFPTDYPYKPPAIMMLTPKYGRACPPCMSPRSPRLPRVSQRPLHYEHSPVPLDERLPS